MSGGGFALSAAAGMFVALALVAAWVEVGPHRHAAGPSSADRKAAGRYAAAIAPLTKQGGQIVVQGLKQGIVDIPGGAFPDETLARMADGWIAQLHQLQSNFIAAPGHSPELDKVRALFDHAMAGYAGVAETLRAAVATTDPTARADRVKEAGDQGLSADTIYDRAQAELRTLQGARR